MRLELGLAAGPLPQLCHVLTKIVSNFHTKEGRTRGTKEKNSE